MKRCDFEGERQAMGVHLRRHHSVANEMRAYCVTNQCPVCGFIFGKKKYAEYHLAKARKKGECPKSELSSAKFRNDVELEEVSRMTCQFCGEGLKGHERSERTYEKAYRC